MNNSVKLHPMPTLSWCRIDFGIASSFLDIMMWQHRARLLWPRASKINKIGGHLESDRTSGLSRSLGQYVDSYGFMIQ